MEEWLATLPDGPLLDGVHLGVVDGTILDLTYPIVLVNPGPKQIGLTISNGMTWHFREDGVVELARTEPLNSYKASLEAFLNLDEWTVTSYDRNAKPTTESIGQKLISGL